MTRCTCDTCGRVGHCNDADPTPRNWYYVEPPLWPIGTPYPVACSRKCAEALRPKQYRGGKAARS